MFSYSLVDPLPGVEMFRMPLGRSANESNYHCYSAPVPAVAKDKDSPSKEAVDTWQGRLVKVIVEKIHQSSPGEGVLSCDDLRNYLETEHAIPWTTFSSVYGSSNRGKAKSSRAAFLAFVRANPADELVVVGNTIGIRRAESGGPNTTGKIECGPSNDEEEEEEEADEASQSVSDGETTFTTTTAPSTPPATAISAAAAVMTTPRVVRGMRYAAQLELSFTGSASQEDATSTATASTAAASLAAENDWQQSVPVWMPSVVTPPLPSYPVPYDPNVPQSYTPPSWQAQMPPMDPLNIWAAIQQFAAAAAAAAVPVPPMPADPSYGSTVGFSTRVMCPYNPPPPPPTQAISPLIGGGRDIVEAKVVKNFLDVLNDAEANPFNGSVALDTAVARIKRVDKDLYKRLGGTDAQGITSVSMQSALEILSRNSNIFGLKESVGPRNRKLLRVYLTANKEWHRNDQNACSYKHAQEEHLMRCLQEYLSQHELGKTGVRVEVVMTDYEAREDWKLAYPMMKRGDYVKLIKSHKNTFTYDEIAKDQWYVVCLKQY